MRLESLIMYSTAALRGGAGVLHLILHFCERCYHIKEEREKSERQGRIYKKPLAPFLTSRKTRLDSTQRFVFLILFPSDAHILVISPFMFSRLVRVMVCMSSCA